MIHYLVKNEGCEVYTILGNPTLTIFLKDKTFVDVNSIINVINSINLDDNTYFKVDNSLKVSNYSGILHLTYFVDIKLIRHIAFKNDRLLITKKPTNLTFRDLKFKIIEELTN